MLKKDDLYVATPQGQERRQMNISEELAKDCTPVWVSWVETSVQLLHSWTENNRVYILNVSDFVPVLWTQTGNKLIWTTK